MTTSYYGLRKPISNVRVEQKPGSPHAGVSIWTEGQLAGRLVFRASRVREFLQCISDDEPVAYTASQGAGKLPALVHVRPSPTRTTIDEYGEAIDLRELVESDDHERVGPVDGTWGTEWRYTSPPESVDAWFEEGVI